MTDSGLIPVMECVQCGSLGFPPLFACRKCSSTDLKTADIPGSGVIYTHTTIRVASDAYRDQAPYDIGIIELRDDLRVTARIAADTPGELKIGDKVDFVRVDDNGYWFKLTA